MDREQKKELNRLKLRTEAFIKAEHLYFEGLESLSQQIKTFELAKKLDDSLDQDDKIMADKLFDRCNKLDTKTAKLMRQVKIEYKKIGEMIKNQSTMDRETRTNLTQFLKKQLAEKKTL